MVRQPEIAKLGHVALVTTDLDRSLWFWESVVGLEVVERADDTIYLRACGERDHHTLTLRAGPASVVDHIAWRTKRPEDVELFAQQLKSHGESVHAVERDRERGQGKAIRFVPPSGHVFEIYYDIEKPPAPIDKRSRLLNSHYRLNAPGVGARRIDHVNLHAPQAAESVRWFEEVLGFKNREYIVDDADAIMASWMSVTPLVHDMAVRSAPDAQPGDFNHVAYWVDNWQDVLRAADIMMENSIDMLGPGRHGITQGMFLYVLDPGSQHKLEVFSGSYLILDPDWEPIKWRPQDLDLGIIWWGPKQPGFARDHHTPSARLSESLTAGTAATR
jgi:catechol 2,3 dioxygenase